jgi:hypothetical protein
MSTFGTQTVGPYTREQGVGVAPEMAEMGTSSDLQTREQGVGGAPQMMESGTEPALVTREQGMTAGPQTAETGTEPQSESDYESESESDIQSEPGTEADFEEYQRLRDLPVWVGDEADEFNAIMERHPEFDPAYWEGSQAGQEEPEEERERYTRPFDINRDAKPTEMNEFLHYKGIMYNPLGRRRGYKKELIRLIKKNNLEDELRQYLEQKNM